MGAFQREPKQLDRAVQPYLAGQVEADCQQVLDIEVRASERVAYPALLALLLQLNAVIIAVAGPGAFGGPVIAAQGFDGFSKGYALVYLLLGQGGQLGAERADRRA